MVERRVRIHNEVGLHARPAALFAQAAAALGTEVTVVKGGREASARSLLSVLTLDIRRGDEIALRAEGDGAEEAVGELVRVLESL